MKKGEGILEKIRGNLVFQVMGYNKLDGEPSDYNVYRDGLLRIVDM